MRKYFIAATIALAVFAVSAFAASLSVDGGTLQAGVDSDLTCADSVEVAYTTTSTVDGFVVDQIDLAFLDAEGLPTTTCDGQTADVALWGTGGTAAGSGAGTVASDAATITFSPSIAVDDIVEAHVLVRQ